MASDTKTSLRGTALAGAAALAAAAGTNVSAATRPKAPGETKIVALFGTTARNNGIAQEIEVRRVFASKRNWRIVSVRAGRLFKPDMIADADLFIICRDNTPEPVDLFVSDAGVADAMVPGAAFWTDANVAAIIGNVRNRGMGLIALHNTIFAGNRRFLDFLDVREIGKHEFEPLWVRRLNREHPVTEGVGKFLIARDEQYGVVIKSPNTATLFETTAVHEKRQAVSGWALESGKGRIVGLLPGSTAETYRPPEYRNILWRAAHWAMNRPVELYPEAANTLYD